MKALTVQPGQADSARLEDIADLQSTPAGWLRIEGLEIGVCGTDLDILQGLYGTPAPGRERLILGHESLGRVVEAPSGSGFQPGDLVVGVVRRPDPAPCANCARGEWDMCRNDGFTERGIRALDGYGAEQFLLEPEFAVKLPPELLSVGVLTEPTSVVAKAWEHIDRIGARAHWQPKRALVTGAGPIGLLAALIGVQRGLEVHVLDQVKDGPKPQLVKDLGAHYHTGALRDACPGAEIVVECTGSTQLVIDAMSYNAPDGIVCLTGVSSGGRTQKIDVGSLNRNLVLENDVVFGSVNANLRHYHQAVEALRRADRPWLERLITRRVPLGQWKDALVRLPYDVKPVIQIAGPRS